MTYIATLAACLLGRIDPHNQYITIKGSSHGANKFFPIEFYQSKDKDHRPLGLNDNDWIEWYNKALYDFTIDDICIIKDSWFKYGKTNWEKQINNADNLAIVSTADELGDWLYCWFNMVNKIPKHIYYRLRERSQLYPKLWKNISKKKKIIEMSGQMPLYPLGDSPTLSVPTLYINARGVIGDNFPDKVSKFLNDQGMNAKINQPILDLHARFSSLQKDCILKTDLLLKQKICNPTGPYDHILCDWYQKGAIGLYPSSSLSYQSGHGIVPSNALSSSVG